MDSEARRLAQIAAYAGTDNLEVMAEAVRYNAFLARCIASIARPGDRIVDFGAGIGTFATQLAKAGHDLVCVEADATQLQRLREAGLAAFASLAEIEPGTVDYVYSLNVIEHIEDDRSSLVALASLLKPGGRILLYVPAFELLYSDMDRKVGHFRRYRRGGLAALAASAGIVDIEARYVDSLGFFAALAYRILGGSGTLNRGSVAAYDRFLFPLSRAADTFLGRVLGKNVLLTGRRA